MEGEFECKTSPPAYERFENADTLIRSNDLNMPQPSAPTAAPVSHVVSAITVSPLQNFGPKPQIADCQYCNIRGKTKVSSKALPKAHCWAVFLFCIGFWPCLCCPYCCCDCSKKFHKCGNCGAFLGTYEP